MNKLLPNLPMEIVNKILITRPTHPIADILRIILIYIIIL